MNSISKDYMISIANFVMYILTLLDCLNQISTITGQCFFLVQGIPSQEEWNLDPNASYVYYCANETIHGMSDCLWNDKLYYSFPCP